MESILADYECGDSGASKICPKQASALRKNGHVMLKGHPCKIVEMHVSKTGKHGHAKVHLIGIDIFDGKKYEDACPSTHNMNVPTVTRTEYQLIRIDDDGFMSLLTDDGYTREDLKLPNSDLAIEIQNKFDKDECIMVSVLKAVDREMVVGTKNMS